MNQSLAEIRFTDLVYVAQSRAASDIHLIPGVRPSIRVDGAIQYVDGPIVTPQETLQLAECLLDRTSFMHLAERGDVTCTWTGSDRGVMRVHGFRAQNEFTLSIRLLSRAIPALESLQLPAAVKGLADKQNGLVLFAGPTGSGKSTSMAALIGEINRKYARRIVTIEDPVEYRHMSDRSVVVQREVGRDVGSFSEAVVGALRADPDIVMIGEMRDAPTMRAAMTAAETGHLVLATLHTGDAVQTVDRIIDAFTGNEQAQIRVQLASTLTAVVCQRLVPRASESGRRVAAEVLTTTDAVRATIREGRSHQLRNLMLTGRQFGMQTLEHHLSELLSQHAIDWTNATAASNRHSELREMPVTTL